ncbi:hypothetical protein EPN18_10070 [bacterium]|nr:MAG: hypothetical protein EPN18_10070 [bacterium]
MPDQLNIFEQDLIGLGTEEAAVWRVIREHKGKDSAIKADTLAWRTSLPEVKAREIVSRLVRASGKLIGSSTGNPPGYYVITDETELRKHIESLRHRGIMCLVRAAALSKTSIEDIFEQGRLELNGDCDGK